jgi:hypothetical protein
MNQLSVLLPRWLSDGLPNVDAQVARFRLQLNDEQTVAPAVCHTESPEVERNILHLVPEFGRKRGKGAVDGIEQPTVASVTLHLTERIRHERSVQQVM